MTTTQTKTEFLTEAMIEQVNNLWKVYNVESGHTITPLLKYEVAKKYIKVYRLDVVNGEIKGTTHDHQHPHQTRHSRFWGFRNDG
ncbi:hypothetical protein HOQ62_gp098 [Synechococcus phage ACG-2014f_Syn7803C8]|uniref:Uncharacterized protein n=1 Tax=Synechococcus phage ACG-2014f_Syn7803C8 TaxID=2790336 RepID=A0A0E3F3X6_9CAUD|nr:hypothetical protein HOQ62_gp098 [Synechococcus phage ACG-2014f_Syn7803C8]AIX21422.1 hypothetical protein Syn7803C8_98 [Synechococcus phage ACG-2014f_Syn7803C8]